MQNMQNMQNMQSMQNSMELQDPYYGQNPAILNQDYAQHSQQQQQQQPQQGSYKMYRTQPPENHTSFSSVPMGPVITGQPLQSCGSQILSSGMSSSFGVTGPAPMVSPQIGIPLPGLHVLERISTFKIQTLGILEGRTTCSPGYKIHNLQGELMLNATSDTLFCPFDSKQKSIYIRDTNEDCIFQIKFTPSICECDSEEKRCFAVFSPVFENPFGAILFEAGQLKHSLKILNALEGETFAVQFLGTQDVSIKGADGSIVAVINIHKKRGEGQKYTLTFMEEVSLANKALFIGCAITLNLVSCESVCSRCICLGPLILACLAIIGLSVGSVTHKGPKTG